jgi:hypothetical protein
MLLSTITQGQADDGLRLCIQPLERLGHFFVRRHVRRRVSKHYFIEVTKRKQQLDLLLPGVVVLVVQLVNLETTRIHACFVLRGLPKRLPCKEG